MSKRTKRQTGTGSRVSREKIRKKKKKATLKGIIQTLLGVLLIVIALGLLAIEPLKNWKIEQGTTINAIGNFTRDQIAQNELADVTYDFQDIQNINAVDVLRDGANPLDLPTIGAIAIPRVNMNLPIYKGVSNEGMYYGAGTLNPEQRMGEGNYALASHHSKYDGMLFQPLMDVELGDVIYLTDLVNIYEYTIDYYQLVDPTRVDLIQPTVDSRIITLITCDYDLVDRVAVQGTLTNTVAIENASADHLSAFSINQSIPE